MRCCIMCNGMYSLKNLSAGYSNFPVLKNLSLTLQENSFISLIGPNGSGKTTLLKVLAGLLDYSGSVKLHDKELRKISRKNFARSVGFVMSAKNFHPSSDFTVKEIIAMGRLPFMSLFSRLTPHDNEIIYSSADTLKISCILDRKILSLSDGQKQLTLLACVLAQKTKIILLDEPTSSLDPDKSAMVFSLLRKLADNGKLIIAAVHDINSAMPFSHGYLALKDGVLISHGHKLNHEVLEKLYGTEFYAYYDEKGNESMWRALPK